MDRLRHVEAVFLAEHEIFDAVRWGGVDEAGALVGGHVVARQQADVMVVALPMQRMAGDGARELVAGEDVFDMVGCDAGRLGDVGQQAEGDQDALAGLGEGTVGDAVDPDQRVLDGGTVGDGAVAGQRPGRGRPDDSDGALEARVRH